MAVDVADFEPWLSRWSLTRDGAPFVTPYTGSRLLPVRRAGAAAMLKVSSDPEERAGGAVMAWWDGDGAAPVLAHEGEALLLLRATGADDLPTLSRSGADDRALQVLCEAVARLHRPRPQPPRLPSLRAWFASLDAAQGADPRLGEAWRTAERLLSAPQDVVVLHGDIHHENVLDFGAAGWLAIDPKGIVGERAYDYANIFRNPDAATALAPGRMAGRLAAVSRMASLEPSRLLGWIVAHAGLSAAWSITGGGDASWSLSVLDAALAMRAGTPTGL